MLELDPSTCAGTSPGFHLRTDTYTVSHCVLFGTIGSWRNPNAKLSQD